MIIALLCFLAGGAIAGVFAGLLGVGGGIIIVPLLSLLFPLLKINPDYVYHLALGTSLASIMVTSISSARAHNAKGAVRWDIFKCITPGILMGTFAGGLVASHLPSFYLKIFFITFLYFVAFDMLFGKKNSKKNVNQNNSERLPGVLGISGVGMIIGMISSFVGIGGGTMSVPFMNFCRVPLHTAVGTSSAIGFPIALAGTLGYIVGGYGKLDLPEFTFGYVHLLAFFGLSLASFFTAPFGAALAHKVSVPTLKKFFAFFLLVVASRMLWNLL